MAIKLPPNWCNVTLKFALCYYLSEIFSFSEYGFAITNSADPDKITHRVAFHLGLPCSIKYPIRVSGIQRVYKGLTSLIFWERSGSVV